MLIIHYLTHGDNYLSLSLSQLTKLMKYVTDSKTLGTMNRDQHANSQHNYC